MMLYNVILWFNYYANSKMHIFTKVYKKFHNNILHIIYLNICLLHELNTSQIWAFGQPTCNFIPRPKLG
jgi:hypothetical protein